MIGNGPRPAVDVCPWRCGWCHTTRGRRCGREGRRRTSRGRGRNGGDGHGNFLEWSTNMTGGDGHRNSLEASMGLPRPPCHPLHPPARPSPRCPPPSAVVHDDGDGGMGARRWENMGMVKVGEIGECRQVYHCFSLTARCSWRHSHRRSLCPLCCPPPRCPCYPPFPLTRSSPRPHPCPPSSTPPRYHLCTLIHDLLSLAARIGRAIAIEMVLAESHGNGNGVDVEPWQWERRLPKRRQLNCLTQGSEARRYWRG